MKDDAVGVTLEHNLLHAVQADGDIAIVGIGFVEGQSSVVPVVSVSPSSGGTGTADVVFGLDLFGGSSLQFLGQTYITVPVGGMVTFDNLAPGTYEMTGTVGAYGTAGVAFANGGGGFGRGGVVPGSLKSIAGPPGPGTIVSACSVIYMGLGSSQSFRFQFAVTTTTSAACQMGQ
jgi:hypothetical protein